MTAPNPDPITAGGQRREENSNTCAVVAWCVVALMAGCLIPWLLSLTIK